MSPGPARIIASGRTEEQSSGPTSHASSGEKKKKRKAKRRRSVLTPSNARQSGRAPGPSRNKPTDPGETAQGSGEHPTKKAAVLLRQLRPLAPLPRAAREQFPKSHSEWSRYSSPARAAPATEASSRPRSYTEVARHNLPQGGRAKIARPEKLALFRRGSDRVVDIRVTAAIDGALPPGSWQGGNPGSRLCPCTRGMERGPVRDLNGPLPTFRALRAVGLLPSLSH